MIVILSNVYFEVPYSLSACCLYFMRQSMSCVFVNGLNDSDYRYVAGVSHVVRHVRTWSRV